MRGKYAITALVVVTVSGFLAGAVFSGEREVKGEARPPQPPPPPAELKALDAFVGQWRSTYQFMPAMFGEAGEGTGRGTCVRRDYRWYCQFLCWKACEVLRRSQVPQRR